jgi:hypothetical protein
LESFEIANCFGMQQVIHEYADFSASFYITVGRLNPQKI